MQYMHYLLICLAKKNRFFFAKLNRMFRALSVLNTPKEGFIDHQKFAVDQTQRFTKQYPNSYLTSQTDPALLPNTVMGLSTWNPTTRQPTQRDLNLSEQAISLDVGNELQAKNNQCKAASIDELINSQDPNARLRCGWMYKKGDPGTNPRVSQGVLATRSGPVPMFDAPEGTFYWDLYDAQKAIVKDRCLSMTSCSQVGTPEFQNCAYSKTRGTGIPVMGNGNIWYPRDPVLTAPLNSLVRTPGECPAPPPPNSPQAELMRSRDVCAPLPDGRFSRDCMLQQITAAGCSTDGTLYKQLITNATPNNYGAGLTNEFSFKKYQQLASQPLNESAIRDGSVGVGTALATFSELSKVAKKEGTGALSFAARDLCVQKGVMDTFDFCTELTDGTPPPFALDCLQKEFRRQGGQPAGTDYPSAQNMAIYNGMRNWGAVRSYITNLANQTKTAEGFTDKKTEGFQVNFPSAATQEVANMVNNGQILNYFACVDNPRVQKISRESTPAGTVVDPNAPPIYFLCRDYYNKGYWTGVQDPNEDDRKAPLSPEGANRQRNALKRFYGITEANAQEYPQIPYINGSEYMWFDRSKGNMFMGRRLNVQSPNAPSFDDNWGGVQGTGNAETVAYIYLANLRPPTKQRVRLKYVTDDGMLFTLNRDINPDAYANVRVDSDSIFGVNWLQPPTQHIQNSCWSLRANGANYILGFWYENFGYAVSQLQYASCEGGAYQNVPSSWITLTIEPDAPMISYEVIKKGEGISFQEYRIPNVIPLMISPKVGVTQNGLQCKTGLGTLSAYSGINFSPNSWRSLSCSFIVGPGNVDPNNPAYCGNLGRQSSDGRIRLYNRGECDTLGGTFHGNGECTKPQGGSFSWDCRNAGSKFNLPMVGLGDWFWLGLNGTNVHIGGYLNTKGVGPLNNVLKPDGKTKHYAVAVMKSENGGSYPNRITIAVGTEDDWKSGRASLVSPTNAVIIRTNNNGPIFNPSDSLQLTFGSCDATVAWCRMFDYEMTDKDVMRDIGNSWKRAFF